LANEAEGIDLDAIQALLRSGAQRRLFSGAALCVIRHGEPVVELQAGCSSLVGPSEPILPDTPFDLASLTKVLAAAPLALVLADQGRLGLDAPLQQLLPAAPAAVTARHCLQHSSGLPAWDRLFEHAACERRPWGTAATRAWALARVCAAPVVAPPGAHHRYSDLGMMLLAGALEVAGGDRFDRLWAREVQPRLGQDLRWGWPGAVATEHCPLRRRLLRGEVHDLNCAVLGGFSAHAGLFGSARSVALAGDWWLRVAGGAPGVGLSAHLGRAAFTDPGPGTHRLGWDGITPGASAAGPHWPLDGVGHLGFTGTSLYLAPRLGLSVALLANRVHPVVEGGAVPGAPLHPRYAAFKSLRRDIHSAVLRALGLGGE
jgi:CubicO group peptidase (beta-lactamase class C family)